jgi:proteasome lid subunit RPN8/RPN11
MLSRSVIEAMMDAAVRCAPLEMCGVVTSDGEWIEVTNIARSAVMFCMDPAEQLAVWPPLYVVHSHPNDGAYPSAMDVAYAHHPLNIIVSVPHREVRAFSIVNGLVAQLLLDVPPSRA